MDTQNNSSSNSSSSTRLEDLYSQLFRDIESKNLPLAKTEEDIVPGEGRVPASVMFIGEAPGHQETIERRPFVGRSGKFFRSTLQDLEIDAEDVYISNVVKVRPPDNRDPSIDELLAYKPYLDEEILIVDPLIIVTLGRFSMAKFLPDLKISQIHGRLHKVNWNNRMTFVLPMYHPAAGLRSTRVKNAFIDDFNKIPKAIEWIKSQQSELQFSSEVKEALF